LKRQGRRHDRARLSRTLTKNFLKGKTMQLITENIRKELIANWQDENENKDPFPVVKLFNPVGAATWLITEMVADQPDNLFGLGDVGFECPELGYVSLSQH
jgi:hypothetical protein